MEVMSCSKALSLTRRSSTVMNGAAAMLKFQPDWIVAIGGGSPIDAAKAMWIKYEYPECHL